MFDSDRARLERLDSIRSTLLLPMLKFTTALLLGIVSAKIYPLRILYGEGDHRTYFFIPTNEEYEIVHRQTGLYSFETLRHSKVRARPIGLHWALVTEPQAEKVAVGATILALDKHGLTEQFTVDIGRDDKRCFENLEFVTEERGGTQMVTSEMRFKLNEMQADLQRLCTTNGLRTLTSEEYFNYSKLLPGKYVGEMKDEIKEEVKLGENGDLESLIGVTRVDKNFSGSKRIQAGGFLISQIRFHNTSTTEWNDLYLILTRAPGKLGPLRQSKESLLRAFIRQGGESFGKDNIHSWYMAVSD